MTVRLAQRILARDKGRSALAIAGIGLRSAPSGNDDPGGRCRSRRGRGEDTVFIDGGGRRLLGMRRGIPDGEPNGTKVRVAGTFALGPDFRNDGTVIMSESLVEQLLPYATLKAIDYRALYLLRLVLEQARLNGLFGLVPACLAAVVVFRVIAEIARLLTLRMTPDLTLDGLALTLDMALITGLIALCRVVEATPAEAF